jgi:hypothetical protein
MNLVAIMNNNRFTETLSDNNQSEAINMDEDVEYEIIKTSESDISFEKFTLTTEKHLHSNGLMSNWKYRILPKFIKDKNKPLFFYYIENGKVRIEEEKNPYRWDGNKYSCKHEKWQETFIEQLYNYVSSITNSTWRRTYDKSKSCMDIYQFDYEILPAMDSKGVAGFATTGGLRPHAIIVNKHFKKLGQDDKWLWWKGTMTHELGHALGLSHTHSPDCDNKDECKQNDSDKTISYMSYKNSWPMNYAAEIFSELDIRVLQHYWGKNEDNYACPYDEGIFWINNNNSKCKY